MSRGGPKTFPPGSPEKAFNLWIEHGRPTLEVLCKIIKEKLGFDVAESTVKKWKDSIPGWTAVFIENGSKGTKIDPVKLIDVLKNCKEDAKGLEADHFAGVKAQLVARLYLVMKELPINSVEDWERALSCCDKLEALIHTERGRAVADRSQVGSLMQAMAAPVNIAPFKKPNGSNGHGVA